jgi:hypothetical protein
LAHVSPTPSLRKCWRLVPGQQLGAHLELISCLTEDILARTGVRDAPRAPHWLLVSHNTNVLDAKIEPLLLPAYLHAFFFLCMHFAPGSAFRQADWPFCPRRRGGSTSQEVTAVALLIPTQPDWLFCPKKKVHFLSCLVFSMNHYLRCQVVVVLYLA